MKKGMFGKRIVIGGTRKLEELCTLVEKQGGVPLIRSLQGTIFLAEEDVERDLAEFVHQRADWVIFTTGIGFETLLTISAKLGLERSFLQTIRNARVASRGYKTLAALKKFDINPESAAEDGTTKGLMAALEAFDLKGKRVMVQLHGEHAPALIQFLEYKGASVQKILPYQHIAPEAETVDTLCRELQTKSVDAVCFTTATQVRSLFDYAREHQLYHEITNSFKEDTLAVAVGKVTMEALNEEGIDRVVVPENERMGAMIMELVKYFMR